MVDAQLMSLMGDHACHKGVRRNLKLALRTENECLSRH